MKEEGSGFEEHDGTVAGGLPTGRKHFAKHKGGIAMSNPHVRALTRFWWVLLIGVGVATIAAVEMVASISLLFPPKATFRSRPIYTATQLVLVNSGQNPYLRTGVTTTVPRPARTTVIKPRGALAVQPTVESIPQAPSVSVQPPDVNTLIRAANFYPHLIMSDQVLALRNRMFGTMRGEISAKALNSVQTPNRFRPSDFPVIQIDGVAHNPKDAIKLVEATVSAFRRWLVQNQEQARVPPGQRILLDNLQVPRSAAKSGGPKAGLPLLVGLAVLAAFAGLVLVLDRLLPQSGGRYAWQAWIREARPATPAAAEPVVTEADIHGDGLQPDLSEERGQAQLAPRS